ncbi:MAG: glucose 1-dehydrogenase [Deltaproteobacteria bacterium]|nr:glucose 1-dehydrogenase [Deltaproteobacteria bacterium]
MTGLNGKVALVTGAASGIGLACARALAGEGARVFVADVDERGARDACATIAAAGAAASALALDVTDETAWTAAIARVRAEARALHVLVNNAGICIAAPLLELSYASWRRQLAVNLDGVFLGTKAALPLMVASGGGSIINVSSVAGLQGAPGLTGYCATKGGVRLFTKAVALECAQARNGVRVNSVHPGGIETPLWAKMASDGLAPPAGDPVIPSRMASTREAALAATPLGVVGTPDDIAAGVVYLASDGARFVTGTELVIDGGAFAG